MINKLKEINKMRSDGEITEEEANKLKLQLMDEVEISSKPKELIIKISKEEAEGSKNLEESCSS